MNGSRIDPPRDHRRARDRLARCDIWQRNLACLNDAMETLEGKVELASSLMSLSLLKQIE